MTTNLIYICILQWMVYCAFIKD